MESPSGFERTWFYDSYSRVYAAILGVLQIAGGFLLLFEGQHSSVRQ